MSGISSFIRDELGGYERMWAAPDTHRYDRHSHDEYSIIVVTEGRKLFRVGRDEHLVTAGQVVLVAPGDSHECEAIGGEDWAHVCWYVQPKFVSGLLRDRTFSSNPPVQSGVIGTPDLASRLQRVHHSARDVDDNILFEEFDALEAAFRTAQSEVTAYRRPADISRRHRSQIYEDALREELADMIDMDELSRLGNVSKHQVFRDLKATRGLSPGRLLKDLRLRQSKKDLRNGRDIAEVSVGLGFADQAHFTRAFTAAYGISPARYKRSASRSQS